jgi:hypothetical protein
MDYTKYKKYLQRLCWKGPQIQIERRIHASLRYVPKKITSGTLRPAQGWRSENLVQGLLQGSLTRCQKGSGKTQSREGETVKVLLKKRVLYDEGSSDYQREVDLPLCQEGLLLCGLFMDPRYHEPAESKIDEVLYNITTGCLLAWTETEDYRGCGMSGEEIHQAFHEWQLLGPAGSPEQ